MAVAQLLPEGAVFARVLEDSCQLTVDAIVIGGVIECSESTVDALELVDYFVALSVEVGESPFGE